ncbi:glycosyltransferase family 4 protein [Pseudomonas chlororaphis]|uniref:MraY family glycosyltransferase n=1 Tax=Pseudomonas chlororaphis TaxID=587753 RepID=UPI001B33E3B9|nr:glycosyltransferase family 4 protein [Pseudomonas chlororaphis]
MGLLWSLPIMAILSLGVTGAFLRYALAHRLMEIPNARSSHSIPTPRSGGVGIVLTFLIALPLAGMLGAISPNLVWSLSGAGAGIALLGFIDDHRPIAARWRLLGHFAGSLWALFWLGGLPALEVFGMTLELGWIGHALAVVYLVWMLNLYNFMDGIDGIACVEAVTSCLSICLIYWLSGYDDLIWPPLLLATSALGFLYWNFPPAKIFMGDIGSGFLGIVLGILSLQAAWRNADFLWVWCILLGVFIVDATFTLIRRFLRGERIYEAHRSHGYQFASRQLGSHFPVTLGVALINLLWLLPIGLFVAMQKLDGGLGVIVAYVPLLILAVKYRAGESERRAE